MDTEEKNSGSLGMSDEVAVLRPLEEGDEQALLDFAGKISLHDLLFVDRDINEPKVVSAWVKQAASGGIPSIIAENGETVVGTAAMYSDQHSWSPHVAEIRVLVSEDVRGQGLGRQLIQSCFQLALSRDAEKVIARMTVDQVGAISISEEMGFRAEALLKEHVRDKGGQKHDMAILDPFIYQRKRNRRL